MVYFLVRAGTSMVIREVAELASVSTATVSKVVTGTVQSISGSDGEGAARDPDA
jgi:Bacterial regulatory proteins, lacI family